MNQNKPNILLIITDQQSSTMMGCAGNRWLKTPHMDALAEKGIRFTRAYATNPVCIPSRYSLMTGRMPSAINMKSNEIIAVNEWSPRDIHEALGHVLARNGYETYYGGKVHLPHNIQPEKLGYTVFAWGVEGEREALGPKTAEIMKRGHEKPWFITASFINPHDICHYALNELGTDPFSLHLKEICVTEGNNVNEALKTYDESSCPPLPPNYNIQEDEPEAIDWLIRSRTFRIAAREQWGEEEWKKHRWVYHRLTESVDRDLGPIIDALNEKRGWENTIIIFTSDHGDHSSSHRLEHKTVLYREAAEVPFILCDPRVPGGSVSDTLVSNGLDIYTTICDYAGVELPSKRLGISLKKSLRQNYDHEREMIPLESEIGTAIVLEDYQYSLYDFGKNREQLYDLVNDPFQTENHGKKEENRERLTELRRKHRICMNDIGEINRNL